VPANAASLQFWAAPLANLQVTFGAQTIPMFQLGSTADYVIWGGDISALAGQTAELRLTGLANAGGYFDNIFFSAQPIPEPGTLGLFGLSASIMFSCACAARATRLRRFGSKQISPFERECLSGESSATFAFISSRSKGTKPSCRYACRGVKEVRPFAGGVGGGDAADALRYLVATKSRAITQRKLRGL